MSTLVYINSTNGVSKSALEVVTYAKKLGNDVIAITVGGADDSSLGALGEYGASKVLVDRAVTSDDAQQLTRVITTAVE